MADQIFWSIIGGSKEIALFRRGSDWSTDFLVACGNVFFLKIVVGSVDISSVMIHVLVEELFDIIVTVENIITIVNISHIRSFSQERTAARKKTA
jgi:hypothetical protein